MNDNKEKTDVVKVDDFEEAKQKAVEIEEGQAVICDEYFTDEQCGELMDILADRFKI